MTTDRAAPNPDGLAATAMAASSRALAGRFLALHGAMKAASLNLVDALAAAPADGRRDVPIDETQHFPCDDVLDPSTGAQYFLHRHAAGALPASLHVHIFRRWSPPELALPDGDTISTHLAALELNARGEPVAWFAVNQWVVGDYWRPADDTLRLFAGWHVAAPEQGRGADIPPLCHQWLAAYLQLNRMAAIEALLHERDALLDRLVEAKPGVNVLEDRAHEVLACRTIDFRRQLAACKQAVG